MNRQAVSIAEGAGMTADEALEDLRKVLDTKWVNWHIDEAAISVSSEELGHLDHDGRVARLYTASIPVYKAEVVVR